MAQQKKKPSGHQLKAIADAKHKNEFMRKLKLMVNTCCGEDIYSLIPTRVLDTIYLLRYHSLKITAAKGHVIPAAMMAEVKVDLANLLKRETVELSPRDHKIALADFMTVGLSLYSITTVIDALKITNANKVKSALLQYCMDEKIKIGAVTQLLKILESIGFGNSNIETRLYWLDYAMKDPDENKIVLDNYIKIYTDVPKSIKIKIDGISRPALRLGWASYTNGMTWLTLKPSLLNISGVPDDQPMEVYIQSHALHRFRERTEGIYDLAAQYYIYESFLKPNVCYDRNHNLLIEYRIKGLKAGYFRFDIVGNIVVLRTFLFLTNSGTPEGDLLGKNTGLKVLDKNYLAIDKLSTFMSSDINKNEQVNKIFSDAGCQSLFELHKMLGDICIKHSDQSPFMLMLDYIRINETQIPEQFIAEQFIETATI